MGKTSVINCENRVTSCSTCTKPSDELFYLYKTEWRAVLPVQNRVTSCSTCKKTSDELFYLYKTDARYDQQIEIRHVFNCSNSNGAIAQSVLFVIIISMHSGQTRRIRKQPTALTSTCSILKTLVRNKYKTTKSEEFSYKY